MCSDASRLAAAAARLVYGSDDDDGAATADTLPPPHRPSRHDTDPNPPPLTADDRLLAAARRLVADDDRGAGPASAADHSSITATAPASTHSATLLHCDTSATATAAEVPRTAPPARDGAPRRVAGAATAARRAAAAERSAAAWRAAAVAMVRDYGDDGFGGDDTTAAAAGASSAAHAAAAATDGPPPPPSERRRSSDAPVDEAPRRRGRAPPPTRARAARGGSDSDGESTTSTDGSSSSDASSRFSTECTGCDRHIARDDAGHSCDVLGCRATRCPTCMPSPQAYLCRQHGDTLTTSPMTASAASAATHAGPAASSAAGVVPVAGGGALIAPPAPTPSAPAALVRALPDVLASAAARGVDAALATLGDWRVDPDMRDLADDLQECLEWGPASTRAKGAGVLRRLRECLAVLPTPLLQAVATADVIDIVLAAFVAGRLRVRTSRGARLPEEWAARPVPEPVSIRGEVSAIAGMMRLAALLPADPRGTLPRTRRIMRKCGCLSRHGSSPRGYTFLWELVAAWESGAVPRDDPQAVAVLGLSVTAVHFLLRPIYARRVSPTEVTHAAGTRYRLTWRGEDKTRPAPLSSAAVKHLAATVDAPRASGAGATATPPAPTARSEHRNLPAKHPRISGSQGSLLHEIQQLWRAFRGPDDGPLFCRVEPASQTQRVPPGAQLRQWQHPTRDGGAHAPPRPTFVWPASQMSERVWKRWLVRFLTPIIGVARARKRVLSGFRGGGEMELVELRTPVSVRATIGWWVARRLSAEGALVTYEGSSLEAMWAWTAMLGTLRLRVLAPGVHRHVAHPPARGARGRRLNQRRRRATIEAAQQAAAASAALAPTHAAPHLAVAAGAGAASASRQSPPRGTS